LGPLYLLRLKPPPILTVLKVLAGFGAGFGVMVGVGFVGAGFGVTFVPPPIPIPPRRLGVFGVVVGAGFGVMVGDFAATPIPLRGLAGDAGVAGVFGLICKLSLTFAAEDPRTEGGREGRGLTKLLAPAS